MDSDATAPRSRRALLAAAAGTAAALAASAALPLSAVAADPNDVVAGTDNATTATTSVSDSGADSTALAGNATGSGYGFGLLGTSAAAGGVVGWSVSAPDGSWFSPIDTRYTGVFGSAPAYPDTSYFSAGVWGDSADVGVYGSGAWGVWGDGGIGVVGNAIDEPGSEGVRAQASSNDSTALRVLGKVSFSRSGRVTMSKGTKTRTVNLSGTTATSKVFAVLATSESGRWVRAVHPATGSFKIFLNTSLATKAVVSWFVLD
jgi:hypothetical protein